MESNFFHLSPPGHLFSFFYSLAFTVALLMLLYEGYRRKFPMLPWILIVSFSQILFIIGSKLFALSGEEWREMVANRTLVPAFGKELFGGVAFLIAGLWIGKKWMKFKPRFGDAFAIAIPLALVFQKVGCFFAGCCFGKPCDLPWAVQYPVYTLPHFYHHQQALIGQAALFSLPVHPVQLYELLGALLVVVLVVMLQKRWKQPGSSLLFSVSLYLVVRFAVEFFKDPVALAPGGAMAGMLNQMQWGILVFLPGLLFFLVLREKKSKPVSSPEPAALPSAPAIASFLALSVLLIVLLSAWFQPMETGMIFLFFTLAAGMAVRHIFSTYKQTGYRLMYAVFLIIPFILMGQTLPRQIGDSVKVRRSTSVGLGIGTGSYDNSVERFSGEGCDGIRNTAYFNQKYLLGGASLNFKNENITRRAEWNYGVDAILGKHTESLIRVDSYPPDTVAGGTPLPDPERKTIFSISPYFSYDARWAGIGGGLHIGQMSYAFYYQEEKGYGIPPTGRKVIHFFPRAYLRFGPRDIAFMDYHLASHFPSAWPGYLHMIGLGTGFGITDGAVLRVGTLYGGKDYGGDWDFLNTQLNGFYATGMVPLKNGITLEPLFLFSSSEAESNMNIQFSVGLRYELGHKMVTRAVMPF